MRLPRRARRDTRRPEQSGGEDPIARACGAAVQRSKAEDQPPTTLGRHLLKRRRSGAGQPMPEGEELGDPGGQVRTLGYEESQRAAGVGRAEMSYLSPASVREQEVALWAGEVFSLRPRPPPASRSYA